MISDSSYHDAVQRSAGIYWTHTHIVHYADSCREKATTHSHADGSHPHSHLPEK